MGTSLPFFFGLSSSLKKEKFFCVDERGWGVAPSGQRLRACFPACSSVSVHFVYDTFDFQFSDRFLFHLKGRKLEQPMNLIPFVETAMGLLNFKVRRPSYDY